MSLKVNILVKCKKKIVFKLYGRNGAETAARLAVRSRVKMERLDNIALFPDESRRKYICLSLTYRQLLNNEVIFSF